MGTKRANGDDLAATIELSTAVENDIIAVEESVLAAFDATDNNVTWDIRIYKLDKTAGNAEDYLFSVLPGELDGIMDRVRDSEGTGTYRVRAYVTRGKQKQVFKQTDFRVKAPAKPIAPPERQSDMAAVLAAINASNDKTLRVLERLAERAQPSAVAPTAPADPFESMAKMATAMAGIMAVMRPAEGSTATDLILKGVKFASDLREAAGDEDEKPASMWDMVRELLKSPLIARIAETVPTALPVALPAPVKTNGSQPPPAPNNQQGNNGEAALNELRKMVFYLLGKAKKGAEPLFYADWVMDEWPPDMIISALQQPDLISLMKTLVPDIAPHEAWFTKLIDELRKLVVNAQSAHIGGDDVSGNRSPVQPITNPGWGGGNEGDA